MFSMLLAAASAVVPSNQPTLLLAHGDDQPGGDVEESLKRNGAPDVCPVIFSARIFDVEADRLQFAASASRSASLRWANSATSDIAVDVSPIFGEVACRGPTDIFVGFDCANTVVTSVLGGGLSRLGIGGG